MVLAAENANRDLPPIGFCNEFLLGSKHAVVALLCDEYLSLLHVVDGSGKISLVRIS
jgi:hypothetical protein